nr:hypothetical protein CFP56_07589 [Quercus suber]
MAATVYAVGDPTHKDACRTNRLIVLRSECDLSTGPEVPCHPASTKPHGGVVRGRWHSFCPDYCSTQRAKFAPYVFAGRTADVSAVEAVRCCVRGVGHTSTHPLAASPCESSIARMEGQIHRQISSLARLSPWYLPSFTRTDQPRRLRRYDRSCPLTLPPGRWSSSILPGRGAMPRDAHSRSPHLDPCSRGVTSVLSSSPLCPSSSQSAERCAVDDH